MTANLGVSEAYQDFEDRIDLADLMMRALYIACSSKLSRLGDVAPKLVPDGFPEFIQSVTAISSDKRHRMDHLFEMSYENTLVEAVSSLEKYIVSYISHELGAMSGLIGDEKVEIRLSEVSDPDLERKALVYYAEQRAKKGLEALIATARTFLGDAIEDDVMNKVAKARIIRNLLMHSKGIVTERFIKEYKECCPAIGTKFCLTLEMTFDLLGALRSFASNLDRRGSTMRRKMMIKVLNKLMAEGPPASDDEAIMYEALREIEATGSHPSTAEEDGEIMREALNGKDE